MAIEAVFYSPEFGKDRCCVSHKSNNTEPVWHVIAITKQETFDYTGESYCDQHLPSKYQPMPEVDIGNL